MRARVRTCLAPIAIAIAVAGALSSTPSTALAAPARSAAPQTPAAQGRAFLKVAIDRRRPFVGEAIPLKFKAYFRVDTGATVQGAPQLAGADFTTSDRPDDLAKKTEVVGGVAYRVAEWEGTISPVKPGPLTLTAKLPATINWQEEIRRKADVRRRLDPLFERFFADDPDMARMLESFGDFSGFEESDVQERSQELVLESEPVTLDVRALPSAGRPADFSGAVGRFTLETRVEPARVHVGEPATVTTTIRGEGSFDRVALRGIEGAPGLRVYAPSPTRLRPEEASRAKTFSQVVVPTDPAISALPPIQFSYFDPKEEKYVTLASDPLPIEVQPALAAAPNAPTPSPNSAPTPGLVAEVDSDRHVETLVPPHLQKGFWLAQLVPFGALALVAGGAAAAKRRDRNRARRAAEAAFRARLAEMRAASARGDSRAFLIAAGDALREHVAERFGIANPDALTPEEVEAHLGEHAEALRPILQGADAARYGGRAPVALDFNRLRPLVEKEILS